MIDSLGTIKVPYLRVNLLILLVLLVHFEVQLGGGERHSARRHQPRGHQLGLRADVHWT